MDCNLCAKSSSLGSSRKKDNWITNRNTILKQSYVTVIYTLQASGKVYAFCLNGCDLRVKIRMITTYAIKITTCAKLIADVFSTCYSFNKGLRSSLHKDKNIKGEVVNSYNACESLM